MTLVSTKTLRSLLQRALFLFPRSTRVSVDRWMRGKKEHKKLKKADFAVVSLPKSGRTWLRVMLSRYYQQKFDLPEHSVIGFDNFYQENHAAPRILFSHDNVLRDFTGNLDNKKDYYQTKTILMVRDPRDLVVSQFHQWRYRTNPSKRRLHSELNIEDNVEVFDFAMNSFHGIPRNIRFLNSWQRELGNMKEVLVVRYEDMRRNPQEAMAHILSFLGETPKAEQVRDTVEYAKFENMRKMEEKQTFRTDSKQLFARDTSNPDSLKTRRAKIGGFTDYLSQEQINTINAMIDSQLSPEFGYNQNQDT
ncbi:sulfotransferase domain-containing protein [Thiogranum longum]|uniref:Sulfotransferase domain-containing protein n=1 Tax=Thiogranum longum TaxID=1537524 RepID=A0A4R1HAT3_9GAMM|nr:sulfotransferase domain-containing protein [Thiogranum longum]TCK19074.1 sulfotransferase domain-containing protein [Thiogranum longum]